MKTRAGLIKESFDNLPIAVCFFDTNGVVRLINKRMLAISFILMKNGIQTIYELRKALENPPDEVIRINEKLPLYCFPDGKTLRFNEKAIVTRFGDAFTQVTAADVSKVVMRQKELNEENLRLEEANERARKLLEQMPDMVREEEILSMKMRVHDDIGHSILSARLTLLHNKDIEAVRKNALIWEKSIALLCRSNDMPQQQDTWEYAKTKAEHVGVRLIIEGDVPQSDPERTLFVLAVRECITNCVRHAGGTELYISCVTDSGKYIVTIKNNGRIPDAEIKEGGGLSSLRKRIEKNRGEMIVQSHPEFSLTLILPHKEISR